LERSQSHDVFSVLVCKLPRGRLGADLAVVTMPASTTLNSVEPSIGTTAVMRLFVLSLLKYRFHPKMSTDRVITCKVEGVSARRQDEVWIQRFVVSP